MTVSDTAELLLERALRQLHAAHIPPDAWTLGGGTVLRILYNHRDSRDIDIFLTDRQLIPYVSPRLNDACEEELVSYAEFSNFVKMNFREGDVDFVFSRQITEEMPERLLLLDHEIRVESPVEIIARKLFYRSESIQVRDLFDIAAVYLHEGERLVRNTGTFLEGIRNIREHIRQDNECLIRNMISENIRLLDGGRAIAPTVIETCREFLDTCERYHEKMQSSASD